MDIGTGDCKNKKKGMWNELRVLFGENVEREGENGESVSRGGSHRNAAARVSG